MVMTIMTMTLTETIIISPDYGHDCLVYIPWTSQKSKLLTTQLLRGLLLPKSTTASPASHSDNLGVDCEGLGGGSE